MTFKSSLPYLSRRIKDVYDYRNMIFSLVKRDLKGKYRNTVFGFLWNFMNPLFQIIIFYIVFSNLMAVEMENYAVFLTSGMMAWFFFSSSMSNGTSSIVNQGGMVTKINFPREVIPIVTVTTNFVNFLISYAIVFGLIAVTGFGFGIEGLLYLPLIIIIEYVFILGIVFLTSSLNVYYRDLSSIVNVIMMGMIWITPVVYRGYFESELLQTILTFNPMTYFMNVFHDVMYFKVVPDFFDMIICFLLAIVLIIVGWLVFVKLQRRFAEEI